MPEGDHQSHASIIWIYFLSKLKNSSLCKNFRIAANWTGHYITELTKFKTFAVSCQQKSILQFISHINDLIRKFILTWTSWTFQTDGKYQRPNLNDVFNNLFQKGDGHLKFSGQARPLLRPLMLYNCQILARWSIFYFLAIQPP